MYNSQAKKLTSLGNAELFQSKSAKISKFISAAYQELLKGALAIEELDHIHEAAKARAAGKGKR